MKKTKEPAYRNPRLAALHKTASGLVRIGALDKKTMREFDVFCLTKVEPMTGVDIQAIRRREGVSQAVLAHHLNVRAKLVSDWERGIKRPSGPSLKLLSIVKSRGLEAIA
jgi:putative transcriptional regulator